MTIFAQVEDLLADEIAPSLFMHGGSVQLMDYDEESKNVHVKLTGSCAGCAASIFTVKLMMERILKEKLPDAVESVTHEEGEVVNPFFV
jgi:Fe-S cluster biogenesis protein NfuA|tara:strand:+ start:157 stop:423 length:267 start_codon:yes stop_codon:yes gene_type:complete